MLFISKDNIFLKFYGTLYWPVIKDTIKLRLFWEYNNRNDMFFCLCLKKMNVIFQANGGEEDLFGSCKK